MCVSAFVCLALGEEYKPWSLGCADTEATGKKKQEDLSLAETHTDGRGRTARESWLVF